MSGTRAGGHTVKDGRVEILADSEAMARWVADRLLEAATAKADGPFVVALSGGSTPKRLYQILATEPYASRFPWDRTQLFFGDERFVPPDDESNNYNMTNKALLSHVPVPPANVHRMPTDGDPDEAAARYERELRMLYGRDTLEEGRPLFDVVLLGLGENGHTASLFPGTDVLQEKEKWVSSCVPHDAPHTRLTLTYPAIHSSRTVMFLVAGKSKAEVVPLVRSGDPSQPASAITSEGELVWLLDKASAGEEDGHG
ncbi:6-phosphogluconolactonase [Rhizosaccharibacter radicis]|uniref:6-phosphogluconolactonase n=1 Tax=Rhizosaccharibacter radicis TaxID=2782605 RepID=A0ABT1VWB2_9PROT|nr:6-phosphogluconolactonase [Acetobacteraceae bacterium KSS12]